LIAYFVEVETNEKMNELTESEIVTNMPSSMEKYDFKNSTTPETSESSNSTRPPLPRDVVPYSLDDNYGRSHSGGDEDSSISGDEDDNDDESDEGSASVDAHELLNICSERMEQHKLREDLRRLRHVCDEKEAQLGQLTGQLKMAVATKVDLVTAHTELERRLEFAVEEKNEFVAHSQRSSQVMQGLRADIEREFLNEMVSLSNQMQGMTVDYETQLKEKDVTICNLHEKIRSLEALVNNSSRGTGKSLRPMTAKVMYYRKKLGMIDED